MDEEYWNWIHMSDQDDNNVLPCDWPQCECTYECERQDKHEEYQKELRGFDPKDIMTKFDAAIDAIKRA